MRRHQVRPTASRLLRRMLGCSPSVTFPACRRNYAGYLSSLPPGGAMSEQQEGSKSIDYLVGLGGFTAIGIFMYAILRFVYWSFYNRFGITPEEVGLGYIEILTRSAPVLVLGLTVAVGFNALLARSFFRMDSRQVWRVVGITVVPLLAAVLIAGAIRAQRLADFVELGIPVHPRLPIELVAVQVDYVTLEPHDQATGQKQQSPPPTVGAEQAGDETGAGPASPVRKLEQAASSSQSGSEGIEQRTSLLYFGQSNQIAVLYDHVNQQVIRMPMTDVTIIAE
jgi:hypothetical protein